MKNVLILSAFVVIAITPLATTANAETKTNADGTVTTTEPSDKYGAGGKHVVKSDKNYKLIVEVYYDKCGRTRESTLPYKGEGGHKSVLHSYYDENGKPAVRVIEGASGNTSYLDLRGGEENKKSMDPAAAKALIEKLEKTPSAPCPEPPKEQQPKTRPRMPGDAFVPSLTPGPTTRQPGLFEFGIGYNYIYAPDEEEVKNLHGLDASLFVNLHSDPNDFNVNPNGSSPPLNFGSALPSLSFGGEFMAGFGNESFRQFNTDVDVSLDRYVYVFGPRVSIRPTPNFTIFAQVMVGGDHDSSDTTFRTNLPPNVKAASVTNSFTGSADCWAFDFGVGADWRFAEHWSWRIIQASYLATTFSSANNDHWQDNWRVSTGIVFHFGGPRTTSSAPSSYGKDMPISAK